jgi:hypothetical protein
MKVRYTVPSDASRVGYSTNGSTTVFSVPFVFFDDTDLQVVLVNNTTGVETTLALTTNYTVTGGAGAAGSLTTLSTYASGSTLVIQREVPYTQEIDYQANDGFPAEVNEEGLDRATMQIQQAYRRARQSPQLPATFDPENDTAISIPLPEAGKVLVGNEDGSGWDNGVLADLPSDLAVLLTDPQSGDILALASDSVWKNVGLVFNVKSFGAAGDGTTNDTTAIASAVTAAAVGGGVVYFPPGTYRVSAVTLSSRTGVHLVGAGRGATTIKSIDLANTHTINMTICTDCSVSRLTIDGNGAGQTNNPHGIRLTSGTRVSIFDVHIKNTGGYGIGAQDGVFENLTIAQVLIEDAGADGIDIKNKDDGNSGTQLSNIVIKNFGTNTAVTQYTGVDIRGPANLNNITVEAVGIGNVGIRFRQSGDATGTGIGGHQSNLVNFRVVGADTVNAGTIGLAVIGLNVKATNGFVTGCGYGVQSSDSENTFVNVQVYACTFDGFKLAAVDATLTADNCTLIGCGANGCAGNGLTLEVVDNCKVIGGYFTGNTVRGIQIPSGATNNVILGAHFSGNGTDLFDAGTGTKIDHTTGYVAANSGTAQLLSGTTSIAVTHGLSAAPAVFTLTPLENLGSATYAYVTAIGTTTFTINFDADPGTNVNVRWSAKVNAG